MRRVVVTGLGAVTPLGNDAPATWQAAVEGRSGIDWIRSFDASEFPVRVAAEVKDFDPSTVAPPKEARRLERNVLLAVGSVPTLVVVEGNAVRARLERPRGCREIEGFLAPWLN